MSRLTKRFGIRALPAVFLCAACSTDLTKPSDSTPAPPTQLVARALSSTEIDLHWNDNSADEHGFEVWRSSGSAGSFGRLISLGAGVTGYSNTDLPAGAPFCYRVRALGVAGEQPSTFSPSACATTPMPTGLRPASTVRSQRDGCFRVERSISRGPTTRRTKPVLKCGGLKRDRRATSPS